LVRKRRVRGENGARSDERKVRSKAFLNDNVSLEGNNSSIGILQSFEAWGGTL